MKRTLTLLFIASSLSFFSSTAFAQELDAATDDPDAAVAPPLAEAGAEDAGGGKGGGGGGGGATGSGGAKPREYDLLDNESKACSIGGVACRRSGSGLLVAAAALGLRASLRRARRR